MSKTCLALCFSLLVCGCGFKGALYLPQEGDKNTFGPIQTGLGLDVQQPNTAAQPNVTPKATP